MYNDKIGISTGLSAFFFFFLICSFGIAQESVDILDLQWALRFDANNPRDVNKVWDHLHTATTLQGVVNRLGPKIYYLYVPSGLRKEGTPLTIDEYWWNEYSKPNEWLHGRETVRRESLLELIAAHRSEIRGIVLYDSRVAATGNVASAVAGIENLIAVRFDESPESLYSQIIAAFPDLPICCRLIGEDSQPLFNGHGVIPGTNRPSSGSVKCDPYLWFIEHYMKKGKVNTDFGAYYIDQKWRENPTASVPTHHTLSNHDFFVSQQAFFFDLSPWGDESATDDREGPIGADLATLKELLLLAWEQNKGERFCHIGGFPAWAFKYTKHAGGMHEDVETEWEFSRIISAYNTFKDADAIGFGALANASFWQHFPLEESYPQQWVTTEELHRRGYLTEEGKVNFAGRQFVLFYVGDYDASSWVYQTIPTIWDDPQRGSIPLMWAVSPVLDRRVPMALHYLRRSATANDYFVAADNGAGYLMPGMLQEPRDISGLPDGLEAWARHCRPFYEKWGLNVTGFIIDGEAPGLNEKGLDCYESFSSGGIVAQKVPAMAIHRGMPILKSDWDLVSPNPHEAAQVAADRIKDRNIPFHWFRTILKTPTWHQAVIDRLKQLNPNVELLDTPTFFALLKIHLQNE